ncbi:hypothetical protein CLIM01_05208 [Colletotrichum limetticola]|uniref:Uncharacterized protein n=1 Tax=Colletotrichum limetticola TaxID=1209924 RepID=A0ABQ9Q0V2_9PEZI|nr:hypothetical protein CLIM01_05208 [Colletotrichum limetticola]
MQGASATRPMTAMRKDWLRFAPNPSSPLSRIQTSRPTSPLSHTARALVQSDIPLPIPTYTMRPSQSVGQSVTHSLTAESIHSAPPHQALQQGDATITYSPLSPRNRPRGEAGSIKSIWYLLQELVPNYFQLPRFVLPTVLAPSQDFVRPTKDHRHTSLTLCFPMPTTVRDWLGEWRAGRVTLSA